MEVTRLFRVDSPADVVCAGLVANHIGSGRNVLAISSDHALGDHQEYMAAVKALAAVHPWFTVVDVSDVPLNRRNPSSWWARNQTWVETVRWLRTVVGTQLGQDLRIDEVYAASPDHPDVLALFRAFPTARKCCYPHGFDKIDRYAIEYYRPFCSSVKPRPTRVAINTLKRLLWGPDAEYYYSLEVDKAYSFVLPVPWAKESHVLENVICRDAMNGMFATIPVVVQDYYRSLAEQCGDDTWLLLLSPPESEHEILMDTYLSLVRAMLERGARTILCKPHPRHHQAHGEDVLRMLRQHLPTLQLLMVKEHYFFPMEIVFAPFRISGCGSIMSTSMLMLARLFQVPALCPDAAILRTFSRHPKERENLDRWLEDNEGLYASVR